MSDDVSSANRTERRRVNEAIIALIKERNDLRTERQVTEPDTDKETRIDGELRGLGTALDILSTIDDWDLPEWSIGVENADTEEWDWYHKHAVRREDAITAALSDAHEDLGEPLNVYEVYGPMAADGGVDDE